MNDVGIIVFCVIAGAIVLTMAMRLLRSEGVGAISVPKRTGSVGIMGMDKLTVRREAIARDDALVHMGFPGQGMAELSSIEAVQVANWLEMGAQRSGEMGSVAGFVISSVMKGDHYLVELAQYDDRGLELHADLNATQAAQVAEWLRIAASPGRTVAEARRRMTKATT